MRDCLSSEEEKRNNCYEMVDFKAEKMISAYILIETEHRNSDKIVKELRKIEDVTKISVIAGEYDIVVRVEANTLNNINKVTNKIRSISNIKSTNTHIIEKEIAI